MTSTPQTQVESLFSSLPGLEAPVSDLNASFAQLWHGLSEDGKPAPSSDDAKATQVNLVLHLGEKTGVGDGLVQFETAVRFSRRYPSRVVILCPEGGAPDAAEIRAKVYGECTLGKSENDTRCFEFVVLGYAPGARRFLESQVSTCLTTDLPVYYWAHGVGTEALGADFRSLLAHSRRVLVDSGARPAGVTPFAWPDLAAVRDLAYARLLHVRQSIGQFLSRYPMGTLCDELQEVIVAHGSELTAEAAALLGWLQDRIGQCGRNRARFTLEASAEAQLLAVTFAYATEKHFSWRADLGPGRLIIVADFGTGETVLPGAVSLLAPENALSEAMFF